MTAPEIFHRDTDLHLEESAPISWRSIVAAGILLLVPLYDPVAARAESPVTKINAAAATAPVTVQDAARQYQRPGRIGWQHHGSFRQERQAVGGRRHRGFP